MSDFETDARHENQLQTIRKKWNGFGKKYQQKVKRMQDEREETYQQKHMALQEKLRTKNLSLQTLQDEQNEIKNKQKQKRLEELTRKETQAKEQVEQFFREQEAKRQRTAILGSQRMESFIKRGQEIKKEESDYFKQKNCQTETRHLENRLKLSQSERRLAKERERVAFQKYVASYFHKKELNQQQKARASKSKDKFTAKEERLEELERERERKNEELLNKFKQMDIRKVENEKEKAYKTERDRQKRIEKFELMKKNKDIIMQEQVDRRQGILEYQQFVFNNAKAIERNKQRSKDNANERIVNMEIGFQNDIPKFKKMMNQIQNESIFKKSPKQRLEMFKEKKRAEQEKLKKEREEKELNNK